MTENKKKENGRVIKFFIYPTLLISFILAFTVDDLRTAGVLYVVMSIFSLFIFSQKRYQEEVFGIKSEFAAPILVGIGTGILFLVLSAISPAFSLLTPTLSLSVAKDIRFFIIVLLAPLAEEAWRSATIGSLREIYKMRVPRAIFVSAIIFAVLHFSVYGIGLGALANWSAVYGQFKAISGAITAAFLFGLLAGFMSNKFQSILPSTIAHIIINAWLVTKGLIVVS